MEPVRCVLLATTLLRLLQLTGCIDSVPQDHSVDDHTMTLDQLSMHPSFSQASERQFFLKARHSRVVSLQQKCGRMKNRMAIFEDGTKACCRYRENPNELRGELYTYYLSKVLRTWNVPPTVFVRLNFSSEQWKEVAAVAKATGWLNGHGLVMTMYVEKLEPEYLPVQLKVANSSLMPKSFATLSVVEREKLLQWSDLIVMDYLTGHSDRLFCNLINLQWTPTMLERPIHNLARSTDTNTLVLFDNESAFWIGYGIARHNYKYYHLQKEFLQKLCVFRQSTLHILQSMNGDANPVSIIRDNFRRSDPAGFIELGNLPAKAWDEFHSRLHHLLLWVEDCARIS